MFCSKCGNQVPDNAAVCPSCGNQMNSVPVNFESKATVMANSPVESDEPVMTAPMSQMPVYTAPVAPVPQKKNTGMVIGIVVVSIIAVAAIVFAILFATGTISFSKDKDSNTSVGENENGGKPVVKEPEIGSISDLPVVTGDKSTNKAMLMVDFGESENIVPKWVAADYTNYSNPKIYFEAEMGYGSYSDTIKASYAIVDNAIYMKSELLSNQTYKIRTIYDADESLTGFRMYFGLYDEAFMKEANYRFKYIGKEYSENTGDAYVYELITDKTEDGDITKVWIDADTGYWVKAESDTAIVMEVSQIITGDDVEFPEFDFENAIEMN